MKKKYILILYLLTSIVCFLGFFCRLGAYPLLDIDETRYVDMARDMFNTKDFMTLYLNGEFFFEKPPLFFWIECLSFKLSGVVSELTARLPLVILSLLPAGLLLFLCKKVKGDRFAVVSTTTLFTCLEYIFLTKVAILDTVFTSFVVSSVLCYFYTFYSEAKNKKYFWALTYIFSALAVLAKGIPGAAIPALVIIVSSAVFKTYKETLKYSPMVLLFFLVALPWHIIMLKLHGGLFFDEYIFKHHILRFLGSKIIDRSQPWYFYIVTLLWGLFPHIFVLLAKSFNFKNIEFKDKFITLNVIAALTTLIFFSLSGGKLVTYILPVYPFAAVIIGEIWMKYIKCNDKAVNNSLAVFNSLLILSAVLLAFIGLIMPASVYESFKPVQIAGLIIIVPFAALNCVFWLKRQRLNLFFSIALLMACFSGFLTPYIYEFNYSFGQNDLMKFAKIAKENNYTISTYLTGRRYSLLYYGNQPKVGFCVEEDLDWLRQELKRKEHIVIIRNRNIENLPVKIKEKGTKFSLLEN